MSLSNVLLASTIYRRNLRVLVPGAGLGRLAYDVATLGYLLPSLIHVAFTVDVLGFACQGNEFSHYMLLASYFILNAYALSFVFR